MSLKLGMVRGVFSLGSARMAANLLGAVAIIVLARLLTPEDFGIVAIASSILTVVQSCTELSLSSALIQRTDVTRSHIDTAWTMSLLRSLALCLLFAGLAWPLSSLYSIPGLVPVLLISGLTGAVMGMQSPMIALVTKDMRFWPMAIFQLSQKFLSLGAAIVLALVLRSYWAIIAGNALGAIFASLLTYFLVPYRPRFSLAHVREIWSFSGWIFFKQLCETLNWRIDQLIMGALVPKAQLGVYAMADNLAVIPSRETIHPIRHALFPGLANLNGDPDRLKKASLRAQATLAMVTAPLGIGLALVAEPAVKVALGEQWTAAIPFVQISALLYTFGTFSIGLQPVAMALGRTRILFIQQTIVLILKVPALLVGFFFGGLIGAALGRCFCEFVSMFLEMLASKMLTGVSMTTQAISHATTFVGLIAMAVGVAAVHGLLATLHGGNLAQLAVEILAGGAIYVAAIATAWLVSGRPDGPVSEILQVAGRFAGPLRRILPTRFPSNGLRP
jgi:O-antigen/teichoic acid export membrane protein